MFKYLLNFLILQTDFMNLLKAILLTLALFLLMGLDNGVLAQKGVLNKYNGVTRTVEQIELNFDTRDSYIKFAPSPANGQKKRLDIPKQLAAVSPNGKRVVVFKEYDRAWKHVAKI